MLRHRVLTDPRDLERFCAGYRQRLGWRVPEEGRGRWEFHGLFDGPALWGGFWLIRDAPYRSLSALSPSGRAQPTLVRLADRPVVEVGGLWRRSGRATALQRAALASVVLRAIVAAMPLDGMVIWGYDRENAACRRLYERLGGRLLAEEVVSATTADGGQRAIRLRVEGLTLGGVFGGWLTHGAAVFRSAVGGRLGSVPLLGRGAALPVAR